MTRAAFVGQHFQVEDTDFQVVELSDTHAILRHENTQQLLDSWRNRSSSKQRARWTNRVVQSCVTRREIHLRAGSFFVSGKTQLLFLFTPDIRDCRVREDAVQQDVRFGDALNSRRFGKVEAVVADASRDLFAVLTDEGIEVHTSCEDLVLWAPATPYFALGAGRLVTLSLPKMTLSVWQLKPDQTQDEDEDVHKQVEVPVPLPVLDGFLLGHLALDVTETHVRVWNKLQARTVLLWDLNLSSLDAGDAHTDAFIWNDSVVWGQFQCSVAADRAALVLTDRDTQETERLAVDTDNQPLSNVSRCFVLGGRLAALKDVGPKKSQVVFVV
jgi:hypothetical protein